MKNLILGIVLLFPIPAIAADLFTQPAAAAEHSVVAEPYDWGGTYLGIYGGAGAIVDEITIGTFNANGVGGEGIFGGALVGYDFQIGNFVVGVQADIDVGNLETTATVPGFALEASPNWGWSAGGRAGYLVNPQGLLYVGAGFAQTEYEVKITTGGGAAVFKQNYDGFYGAVGAEAMVGNFLARVEYRYTQYGGENWSVPGLDVEPSSHTGRIAVGYKF